MPTGVITPEPEPIVNTARSELLHVPVPEGGVVFDRVVEDPMQTCGVPVVATIGLTVTTAAEKQPLPKT
jgi:hypothetical protein